MVTISREGSDVPTGQILRLGTLWASLLGKRKKAWSFSVMEILVKMKMWSSSAASRKDMLWKGTSG